MFSEGVEEDVVDHQNEAMGEDLASLLGDAWKGRDA